MINISEHAMYDNPSGHLRRFKLDLQARDLASAMAHLTEYVLRTCSYGEEDCRLTKKYLESIKPDIINGIMLILRSNPPLKSVDGMSLTSNQVSEIVNMLEETGIEWPELQIIKRTLNQLDETSTAAQNIIDKLLASEEYGAIHQTYTSLKKQNLDTAAISRLLLPHSDRLFSSAVSHLVPYLGTENIPPALASDLVVLEHLGLLQTSKPLGLQLQHKDTLSAFYVDQTRIEPLIAVLATDPRFKHLAVKQLMAELNEVERLATALGLKDIAHYLRGNRIAINRFFMAGIHWPELKIIKNRINKASAEPVSEDQQLSAQKQAVAEIVLRPLRNWLRQKGKSAGLAIPFFTELEAAYNQLHDKGWSTDEIAASFREDAGNLYAAVATGFLRHTHSQNLFYVMRSIHTLINAGIIKPTRKVPVISSFEFSDARAIEEIIYALASDPKFKPIFLDLLLQEANYVQSSIEDGFEDKSTKTTMHAIKQWIRPYVYTLEMFWSATKWPELAMIQRRYDKMLDNITNK